MKPGFRSTLPGLLLVTLLGTQVGCLGLRPDGVLAGAVELSTERGDVLGADPAVQIRCSDGEQTLVTGVPNERDEVGRRVYDIGLSAGTWSCDLFAPDGEGVEWSLGTLRPGGATCTDTWADETEERFFFSWDEDETRWVGTTVADGFDACTSEASLRAPPRVDLPQGTFCGTASVAQPIADNAATSELLGWAMLPCLRIQEDGQGGVTVEGAIYSSFTGGFDHIGCLLSPRFGPLPAVVDSVGAGLAFTTATPRLENPDSLHLAGVLWADGGGLRGRLEVRVTVESGESPSFVLVSDGALVPTDLTEFPDRLGGDPAACPP
jgi:hypothetical protein